MENIHVQESSRKNHHGRRDRGEGMGCVCVSDHEAAAGCSGQGLPSCMRATLTRSHQLGCRAHVTHSSGISSHKNQFAESTTRKYSNVTHHTTWYIEAAISTRTQDTAIHHIQYILQQPGQSLCSYRSTLSLGTRMQAASIIIILSPTFSRHRACGCSRRTRARE